MLDQLSILKLVSDRLAVADIPYMVTGSIAAGHYGRPRMTRDIDIVVALRLQDASRFVTVLGSHFVADADNIRAAIARHSIFNVIHETAVVKVDFVVRKDDPYRVEEFNRRRLVRIDDSDVWMVAPEDLILSKLLWARILGLSCSCAMWPALRASSARRSTGRTWSAGPRRWG